MISEDIIVLILIVIIIHDCGYRCVYKWEITCCFVRSIRSERQYGNLDLKCKQNREGEQGYELKVHHFV